ncbi:hypothetical protein V6N11_073527 [Hibiscus sabdariffa]|uniref:EB domain-containing protein n=1 Tax=Hibiscus sabdariffa TaxID=183260 RepID=A0ABR2NU88_9ROSI
MVLSMAPRARGQIFIPCTTEEQCKAIECRGGAAHCIKGQCRCTAFEDGTSCSRDSDCDKQCDPKVDNHICFKGHCLCDHIKSKLFTKDFGKECKQGTPCTARQMCRLELQSQFAA